MGAGGASGALLSDALLQDAASAMARQKASFYMSDLETSVSGQAARRCASVPSATPGRADAANRPVARSLLLDAV
jgi:hypothetical protein